MSVMNYWFQKITEFMPEMNYWFQKITVHKEQRFMIIYFNANILWIERREIPGKKYLTSMLVIVQKSDYGSCPAILSAMGRG